MFLGLTGVFDFLEQSTGHILRFYSTQFVVRVVLELSLICSDWKEVKSSQVKKEVHISQN